MVWVEYQFWVNDISMREDSNDFKGIPEGVLKKWQEITDLLADFLSVPSALIMLTDNEYMEVLISSQSENNPYRAGDKEQWYGLYCETVIKTQKKLLVPNATADKNWDQNPDIKLGMIAYLGFPINYPNQQPFGTICVLDNKENPFSRQYEKLLLQFKNVIESDIAFLQTYNHKLDEYEEQQSNLLNRNLELNRAQKKLQESEEKFHALYQNMSEGSAMHTLVYDENGVPVDYRIIEVNPAFISQLEISRESVINKTSREAYNVDVPPYFDVYTRVALTGNPETFETYFAPLDNYFSISVYCPGKGSFATIFKNITEQKQTEKEKEETQKLLEDSQHIGKIGGWELNIDTLELKWTKEMYRIHEVDSTFKPKVDKRVNFYTPESLLVVDKAVQKAIEHGESYDVDLEIITAKGNRRSIRSIGNADFENRRVLGFFQDITERKRIEEELKRSEKELKRAQKITHIGNFYINLTTNEVTWTEELYKIYGFDPKLPPPLLNESQTLFTPESWELLSTSIANTVQTGEPYEIELTTISKDGKNGWMWARGEATKNTEGKITGVWGAVQDITNRKITELALNKTNAYLENLINFANAPIIVWNPQFKITRFNHAFEFITGYTEAEVLGKSLELLFPSELIEPSMNLIRKTLSGERWETVEIQIQHRDTSVRTLLWNSATLFMDDNKTPIATIAQGSDITERKQAEKELKKSEAKLRKLNATKDKFFSIIAHDLKGPFNNILGFSELLIENQQTLSDEEKESYLKNIYTTSKTTYQLLEELLNWARSQSGNIKLEPQKIHLRCLVDEVMCVLEQAAKKKKINILVAVDPELTVFSDKNALNTIIRNLVSNAIKYTGENGSIKVNAKLKDSFVEVSIADTGIGMDEITVQSLFTLTETISKPGTANEKGTGLGLVLCKEFVEKQNGSIWVESEIGVGSTFCFTLPK